MTEYLVTLLLDPNAWLALGTLIAIWPDRRRARVALGSYGDRVEPTSEHQARSA